ncbi:hypothetical protein DOY81_013860, partial [Sarcophaga bullata]
IATAWILYKTSKIFVRKKLQQQTREVKLYAKDTEELQFQREDEIDIPFLVLMAYLFNPLAIFNCAGLTCTVFSNLFLALALYSLMVWWIFVFFYRDLQPNIGLFWYFFTEMFDFRTMFLVTFQMNATVLYFGPLSLKLRKEPILLATILIGLMSIFRAYPCIGDVAFYLALLPMWKRSWKFMAHNFIVFCFFVVSLCMLPALWHLWIYSGSANANFYFGATLAFSTIFLVTDLLFAYVKREFCLFNGQKIIVDGKEAKIVLG